MLYNGADFANREGILALRSDSLRTCLDGSRNPASRDRLMAPQPRRRLTRERERLRRPLPCHICPAPCPAYVHPLSWLARQYGSELHNALGFSAAPSPHDLAWRAALSHLSCLAQWRFGLLASVFADTREIASTRLGVRHEPPDYVFRILEQSPLDDVSDDDDLRVARSVVVRRNED